MQAFRECIENQPDAGTGAQFAYSSFACCYGVAFSLLLSRLLATLTVSAGRWRNVNLLPLIVAFADLAENGLIFGLLALYPREVPIIADLASAATLSKWLLMLLSLAILAASTIRLLWRNYRHWIWSAR